LTEQELAAAFPAFEQMLGYFAAMQAADQDPSINAGSANATGALASSRLVQAGYFRPDAAFGIAPPGGDMLDRAGERDGRFVVIPNVL
jgi:aspartyl-tRNA(Asn)/glutamyl-tRNA(Gln) amidotransferase subunit C